MTAPGGLAAIVLAAGAGSRFGRPKALVTFDGELLVERALRTAVAAGCDPVLLVLGAESAAVESTAALDDAHVVRAIDWKRGMSESLRAGLAAAVDTDAAAAVILLVDQPLVTATAIKRLGAARQAGAVAAVATYDGNPRNPVVLDRSIWAEVAAAAHDEVGARAWLKDHPDRVTEVDCSDSGDPSDIDTPEDAARLA